MIYGKINAKRLKRMYTRQLSFEKKPWWKTLVSIKPIAQPPTTEAEEKLQKVSQEAGCEIDRETKPIRFGNNALCSIVGNASSIRCR